jgi:hypothetical protein
MTLAANATRRIRNNIMLEADTVRKRLAVITAGANLKRWVRGLIEFLAVKTLTIKKTGGTASDVNVNNEKGDNK